MELSLRPSAAAIQNIIDSEFLSPASLEDTVRAMILEVMSRGTSYNTFDDDRHSQPAPTYNNIRVTRQLVRPFSCEMKNGEARLTVPGRTTEYLACDVLDPVLADLFKCCPIWSLDEDALETWYGRVTLADGWNIMIQCTPKMDNTGAGAAAFATIEHVEMN